MPSFSIYKRILSILNQSMKTTGLIIPLCTNIDIDLKVDVSLVWKYLWILVYRCMIKITREILAPSMLN